MHIFVLSFVIQNYLENLILLIMFVIEHVIMTLHDVIQFYYV